MAEKKVNEDGLIIEGKEKKEFKVVTLAKKGFAAAGSLGKKACGKGVKIAATAAVATLSALAVLKWASTEPDPVIDIPEVTEAEPETASEVEG